MSKYKDEIKTIEEAKAFHATAKQLIENTSGTYGGVAKAFNITTDMLRQRVIDACNILNENGGYENLEFKKSLKKEKTLEVAIMPTREEDGSVSLTIQKELVKYLSLEEGEEALLLKVNNQESEEYKPSIELIDLEAFIRNQERKRASSKRSKVNKKLEKEKKKLQKNNVVSV